MASVATGSLALHLHPDDNISIATRRLPKSTGLDIDWNGAEVLTREEIDMGHKVAVRPIVRGGSRFASSARLSALQPPTLLRATGSTHITWNQER